MGSGIWNLLLEDVLGWFNKLLKGLNYKQISGWSKPIGDYSHIKIKNSKQSDNALGCSASGDWVFTENSLRVIKFGKRWLTGVNTLSPVWEEASLSASQWKCGQTRSCFWSPALQYHLKNVTSFSKHEKKRQTETFETIILNTKFTEVIHAFVCLKLCSV